MNVVYKIGFLIHSFSIIHRLCFLLGNIYYTYIYRLVYIYIYMNRYPISCIQCGNIPIRDPTHLLHPMPPPAPSAADPAWGGVGGIPYGHIPIWDIGYIYIYILVYLLCIGWCVVFCTISKQPDRRRTTNHLRKWSIVVLSSFPDQIGDQDHVQS